MMYFGLLATLARALLTPPLSLLLLGVSLTKQSIHLISKHNDATPNPYIDQHILPQQHAQILAGAVCVKHCRQSTQRALAV